MDRPRGRGRAAGAGTSILGRYLSHAQTRLENYGGGGGDSAFDRRVRRVLDSLAGCRQPAPARRRNPYRRAQGAGHDRARRLGHSDDSRRQPHRPGVCHRLRPRARPVLSDGLAAPQLGRRTCRKWSAKPCSTPIARCGSTAFATLPSGWCPRGTPTSGRLLEAYAEGVNAGLASLQVKPFEYMLLGHRAGAVEGRGFARSSCFRCISTCKAGRFWRRSEAGADARCAAATRCSISWRRGGRSGTRRSTARRSASPRSPAPRSSTPAIPGQGGPAPARARRLAAAGRDVSYGEQQLGRLGQAHGRRPGAGGRRHAPGHSGAARLVSRVVRLAVADDDEESRTHHRRLAARHSGDRRRQQRPRGLGLHQQRGRLGRRGDRRADRRRPRFVRDARGPAQVRAHQGDDQRQGRRRTKRWKSCRHDLGSDHGPRPPEAAPRHPLGGARHRRA